MSLDDFYKINKKTFDNISVDVDHYFKNKNSIGAISIFLNIVFKRIKLMHVSGQIIFKKK